MEALVPPGTRAILGVSLRGITASTLFAGLKSELPQLTAGMRSGMPAGLDLLNDVDEVWVASESTADSAPSVVILRGRFNALAQGAGKQQYRGYPLVSAPGQAKTVVAVLGSGIAVAGNEPQVRAAIDRMGSGGASALLARVRQLSGRNDFWAVGEAPGGFSPSTAKGAANNPLSSIDRFEFGASLASGLELSGQAHVASAKDAQQLEATVRMFEMMMKAQQPANGAKLELTSNAGTLTFSLKVSEAELLKGMQAQKAVLANALQQQLGSGGGSSAAAQSSGIRPTADSNEYTPRPQPDSQPKVILDKRGDAVMVTLPGARR